MLKNILKIVFLLSLTLPKIVSAAVNVAVIAPQSGEYEKFGKELVEGVQIAVDQINNNGGINKEKINLITVDDRCDDRLSLSTAQMISVSSSNIDKVQLVIGPFCSNSFKEVSDVFSKAGIFQIVPFPVNQNNLKHNHPGLIKMMGSQDQQVDDVYKFYKDQFADKTMAVVYDSELRDATEIASALQSEFKNDNNLNNFFSYNFNNYEDNFGQIVEDLKKDNIRFTYIVGKAKESAKLAKEIADKYKKNAVITNRYLQSATYDKIIGSKKDGSYIVGLPSLKDNPAFTETLVKLRLHGVEPKGLSVYGYNALMLWENLADRSNSFSVKKLFKTLCQKPIETGLGSIGYTNGNPSITINYSIYQYSGDEYTQVY